MEQPHDYVRTWSEVAAEYTRRNPHDPISRATAWTVATAALAKLHKALRDQPDGSRVWSETERGK